MMWSFPELSITAFDFSGKIILFSLKGLILLLLTGFLYWVFRHASAAFRHKILMSAMFGLLLLPILTFIIPALVEIPLLPQSMFAIDRSLENEYGNYAGGAELSDETVTQPEVTGNESAAGQIQDGNFFWAAIVLTAWGLGTIAVLVWQLIGRNNARNIIRKASPAQDKRWATILRDVLKQHKYSNDIPLLESGQINIPVVIGIRRPTILIPTNASKWSESSIYATLLHETAHLERRDLFDQFVVQIACALHWINPLVWITAQKTFIERERASDDFVLLEGIKPSEYAKHLMEASHMVKEQVSKPKINVAAMAKGTDFRDRMLSVLDPSSKRNTLSRGKAMILNVLIAGFAILLSGLQPWMSSGETAYQVDQGASDQDLQRLIQQLQADDAESKAMSAYEISKMGEKAEYAIPFLISNLGNDDLVVLEVNHRGETRAYGLSWATSPRIEAIKALKSIGQKAIDALNQELNSSDPEVRLNVKSALEAILNGKYDPKDVEVIK